MRRFFLFLCNLKQQKHKQYEQDFEGDSIRFKIKQQT